jgi:hypothetical protein
VLQVLKVNKDHKVLKVQLVKLDHRVTKVFRVFKAQEVKQD